MERFTKSLIYFVFSFLPSYGISQTAGFTTPDTVCVSQPVNITNISSASSYYWNFCVADILNTPPVGVNLGNVGGVVSWPVFSDFVEYNGNFYVFVVNHFGASFGVARLDFGNSLLNTPTGIDFGNFNNILRRRLEGIQIVNEGGKWYAFVVGGDPDGGDVPQLARIDFGSDIANPNPTATDLGNIGGMYQPLDLYMFKENGVWHGFTVNKNGSLTRFEFANGLENVPATQNYPLGLNYPTGVNVINENGDFFVFVTVADDNSIARLDFGNSLLNTPVVNNLGNPGNALFASRDITILRFCDAIVGFAVNSPGNSNLVRLNFHNDIKGVPDAISLGTMNGNLSFPHSLSRLFRVGDNVYSFITNVDNRTITRIQFPSCTNASLSSFNGQSPPPIKYNAPGVYNINLTIDDGLPTQSSFCRQVVVVPEPVHTPRQTIVLPPGGSVKIGTSNPSSTYQWFPSGPNSDSITVTSEGLYIVETSGYGCANIDSFKIVLSTADFSYEQNPCDPLNITFKNETPGSTAIDWDFGNGANAPGNNSPATQYPSLGNYDVTLTVINSNGINESITKSIAVDVQNDSLITTNDTTICAGSSIQLNAVNALNYCWTPSSTLSATNIANPIATPVATTTYYLNSSVVGNNLIVNGNFSSGNTGFTTGYSNATINTTEGEYYIGSNPGAWNPNFLSVCLDHSGTGNMMLVNGNPVPDINIWSQTVTVTPNTNYAFSTWIQSLFKDNPAQLMFSINNTPIGNMITAGLPVCNWSQFYTTWNSGNNTTAVISIINKNTIVWGNDFALDDISFAPVTVKRDSVIITVEEPAIKTVKDTTICEGANVQLDATTGFASYTWSPAAGLSDQKIVNPIATPVVTTNYIVAGKTVNGCDASDTVNIAVKKAPDFITNNDTLICGPGQVNLSAAGDAVSYSWSPGKGLSDSTASNPLTEVLSTTQFVVTGKSVDNCFRSDTVEVVVSIPVDIQARADTTICEGVELQLYTVGDAATFSWSPSSSLSDPSSESPVAQPLYTTEYVITASNPDGCTDKDTVLVTVKLLPVVSITNDTLVYPKVKVQLNASGGSSYSWGPSATLSDPFIANPIAAPDKKTTYVVGVSDIATGCTNIDSVVITLRPYPVFSAIADTAVCKGTDILMYADGGDSYQWSPAVSLANPFSAATVAQPLSSTVYSVYMMENTCHFDTTIDVHITVNPVPEVIAQRSNDINCVVTSARLSAVGANSYQWSPAVHLDNAFKSDPVASIDTTTLFKVVGKNSFGCTGEDTVTVKVTKEGNPLYLVPNTFTPNGDGINDCFGVRKWENIQLEELSVYNRWGEQVFYSTNPMDCWDGTYKGIAQPSGTFIYIIRAKSFCGVINRKGLITLIR